MAKPFSQMTETEKAENRRRLALGLPADFVDEQDASKMTDDEFYEAKQRHAVDAEAAARRRAIRGNLQMIAERFGTTKGHEE